jgi:kynurenine formamidase
MKSMEDRMKVKNVLFLSHEINEETPLYGGNSDIVLKKQKAIKEGDSCNTMYWSFPNHIGTHIDAPLHFIDSKFSITDFSPRDFIFSKIEVARIDKVGAGYIIGPHDLAGIKDCDLLLIKTNFEKYRDDKIYWNNSPCLASESAGWLKSKCPSIRAVGIDFISVSNLNNRELGREAHESFLTRDILLIEDMKLENVERTLDSVIVAPLRVQEADGAPCTILGIYK